MTETALASAPPLHAPHPTFSYERLQRPIIAWRTGPDLESGESPIVGICSEGDPGVDRAAAVPDGANAIRYQFDEDEPPALVFSDQALPGAFVSWAWSQLKALDALLVCLIERSSTGGGEPAVAGAVHTVLGPVINALEFSERRAAELQGKQSARRVKGHKSAAARKQKKTRT